MGTAQKVVVSKASPGRPLSQRSPGCGHPPGSLALALAEADKGSGMKGKHSVGTQEPGEHTPWPLEKTNANQPQ